MLMGEIDSLSSQEPEFSEKEDDEWILVDFIGKMSVRHKFCLCLLLWLLLVLLPYEQTNTLGNLYLSKTSVGLEHRVSSKQMLRVV